MDNYFAWGTDGPECFVYKGVEAARNCISHLENSKIVLKYTNKK